MSKELDRLIDDYERKYHITLSVDTKQVEAHDKAIKTFGADTLRAMWNYYIDDMSNRETVDMGKFLWSSTLNRYARIVGARRGTKGRDEWIPYTCEECGIDKTMSRRDVTCLEQPCCMCRGRMIKESVYLADKGKEWVESGRYEAFMRKRGMSVKKNLTQGIGNVVRDVVGDDELECDYL